MKTLLLSAALLVFSCVGASEEDILPEPQINILRQTLLRHYENPLLKKPLTLYVSLKNCQLETLTLLYGSQVFEVPAEVTGNIKVQNLHRLYLSCEAGYPQIGGFTIYVNIPGTHLPQSDPWYKVAWNQKGVCLFLEYRETDKRKTDALIPFDKAVKIRPVSLKEWRRAHPDTALNE